MFITCVCSCVYARVCTCVCARVCMCVSTIQVPTMHVAYRGVFSTSCSLRGSNGKLMKPIHPGPNSCLGRHLLSPLGVSIVLLFPADPLLCTCWGALAHCPRLSALQEAGRPCSPRGDIAREELFCSVLSEVSSYYTFLQIPRFPIPSDNKTTIC